MAIIYYLLPNPVTADPNDQSARVVTTATLNEDDIISRMLRRGTTVTETDVRAVITLYNTVVTDTLMDGNAVNTYLANYRPGISGVFTDVSDTFDPARHTKKVNVSSGVQLARSIQSASVSKTTSALPSPVLNSFRDYGSDTENTLTPGGTAEISGEQLKYDQTNTDEGIFFIAEDGTATQVDSALIRHTAGTLIFNVPDGLTSGTYTAEVRKGYGTTNVTLRNGQFREPLTVI